MLSKEYRFHGLHSLDRVYKVAKTVRSKDLSIKYAPSNRPEPRIAVVVSKKVEKSAVKRNRIRRRIFEIVRKEISVIQKPTDLIISVFSSEIRTMNHTELQSNLVKLLKKTQQ